MTDQALTYRAAQKPPEARVIITWQEVADLLADVERVTVYAPKDGNSLRLDEWSRDYLLARMKLGHVELTGPVARSEGYPIAFKDELGWVFVKSKPPTP